MRNEIYINPRSMLTAKELSQVLRLHIRTIERLIKLGNFPKPVVRPVTSRGHISTRKRRYWLYQDVISYIDNLKDEVYDAEYPQKRVKLKSVWNEKTQIVEERAT